MKNLFIFPILLFNVQFLYSQIEVSFSTDKSDYLVGENIDITITVYNPSTKAITLFWGDHCQFDYDIDGEPNITCNGMHRIKPAVCILRN